MHYKSLNVPHNTNNFKYKHPSLITILLPACFQQRLHPVVSKIEDINSLTQMWGKEASTRKSDNTTSTWVHYGENSVGIQTLQLSR